MSGGQIRGRARALRLRPILSKYSGALQIHCLLSTMHPSRRRAPNAACP